MGTCEHGRADLLPFLAACASAPSAESGFGGGSFILILDAAEADSSATIGFESDDCDRDFRAVLERGAVALDPPSNKAWGVRAAYVQGPGRLKFEIEGPPGESGTPAA
jgi:hypothetical protein